MPTNNGQPEVIYPSAPALDDDPPLPVQLAILDQEIEIWRNTRHSWRMRHRTQKYLGTAEDQLANLEEEVTRCFRAMEKLAEEREQIMARLLSEEGPHGRELYSQGDATPN